MKVNHSYPVFHIQLTLLKREKGMLLFYFLCEVIIGIAIPVFLHSTEIALQSAMLFSVMLLKPILSDSLSGEREQKTLESLLSACMDGKKIIWGKIQFSLLFAVSFYIIAAALTVMTSWFSKYKLDLMAWQWICIILLSLLNLAVISIAGVSISAVSADSRTANSKVSRITYPLGLLQIIYLSVVFLGQTLPALITGIVLLIIYCIIAVSYIVKVSGMKQSDYFEDRKKKKSKKVHDKDVSYGAARTQFGIVFRQELKYLFTLKTILLNFLLLCFAPVIIMCLGKYYLSKVNLYYAVLITALMMPRTPSNLIAYSIGGEKIYKTGESLLSTPLGIKPLFLAKSMVPVLISAVMILLSSFLTLIGANVIGRLFESGTIYRYTSAQIVLLFPVGIISSFTMVLITGILSVCMKSPRQGLYASSLLGIIFAVPTAAIIFLTQHILLWSVVYFVLLLLCNLIFAVCSLNKIERPQIMNRFL